MRPQDLLDVLSDLLRPEPPVICAACLRRHGRHEEHECNPLDQRPEFVKQFSMRRARSYVVE
jgi:hypothetical protein